MFSVQKCLGNHTVAQAIWCRVPQVSRAQKYLDNWRTVSWPSASVPSLLQDKCSFNQRTTITKIHKIKKSSVSSNIALKALTWFFGCDINYVALWTHSSTVIGPQGHEIGTSALQIPDEYRCFIPHCSDDTGCVLLLLLTPVLHLKNKNRKTNIIIILYYNLYFQF